MDESIRVLHVDDEPDFADLTATFLEREDDRFTVETATTTDEGLDRLTDEIDCIVSDYDMPGMNGIEFLETVREEFPDLPFILFTGKGSEEVASEAVSAGATNYLQKESGTDQYTVLANRITNAVAQYRAEQQVERTEQRYRRLIEESSDVITVVDEAGTFQYLSPAVERILGYSAENLIGENGFEYIHPDDRESAMERFTDLAEHPDRRDTYEFRFEHADGSWIWLGVRGRNLLDDPLIDGLVIYARDITERKEREQELRRKERRYQAVFNDPNILVGLLEPDGTVLDINQTAMEYITASREEVAGQPFWETPWFDHSSAIQREVKAWVDQAARGEYVDFEATLLEPSGEPYAIEGVFRPVTNDDGEVVSLIISDREVTEREERERQLGETNALLSTLLDTLPVGVLAEDASRNVLAVNQRMCELFEIPGSPAEISGTDCEHLVEEISTQCVDPDGFINRINEVVAERQPVHDGEVTLQDGQTLAWCHEPIELPDGDGHLWVCRDITDRKKRERELRQARNRMEFALDATDAIVWTWNVEADQATFYPSAETLYGTTVDTWDDFLDVIHPDDRQQVREAIERSLETGEPKYEEVRVVRDGDVRWIEAPGQPVQDDGPTRMIGVARDITDRKRNERALQRQNERLEQFASIVSHDLRNPLNIAEGRLELAQAECESDQLDAIARAHDRMRALIEDLLTLARQGDSVDEMDSVDLAAVIRRCWRNVETANADLVIDTDCAVRADRSRLKQLVENLIRNAIDHGGADVTVTVGDLDADGFYVADTGPGIPEDEHDRVFEASYTTAEGGTGFGLTIVRQIVDAHGWEIRITESESGGARFEITDVAFAS